MKVTQFIWTNQLLRDCCEYAVKLIWSNFVNQINLIVYTATFETFLFD